MQHLQRKYKYDIALDEGVGAHIVTWVTGLMVFFVTLALAVNLGLNAMTQNWVTGLSGALTIEIKAPAPDGATGLPPEKDQQAFEEGVQKVLWLTKQHPAVKEGHALSKSEIQTLIRPWLGEDVPDGLPLPAIIDIKLNPGADAAKLQADILALVPAASVDTHDGTLDDVKTLAATVRLFVLLLTGAIVLIASAAVASIVRAKLALHAKEVETLHLIGASDEYIARQFRQHALKGSLRGSVLGLLAMVLLLVAAGYFTRTLDLSLLPRFNLNTAQWVLFVTGPLFAGSIIAHLTAQRTVMKELAKLP
jgi:cell division transport system permease protein